MLCRLEGFGLSVCLFFLLLTYLVLVFSLVVRLLYTIMTFLAMVYFLMCNRRWLAEICPTQRVCITMLQRSALLACEPQRVSCLWNIKCTMHQLPSVHTISAWEITVRNGVTAPNWRQSPWYFPSKQCGFTKVTQNEIAGSYYAMHIVLFVSFRYGCSSETNLVC